jgi:broad specificity phosphatase PhoE
MPETRLWMIRHAIVEESARLYIYGASDVELCPHSLEAQVPMYAALARRLPKPGPTTVWVSSTLTRAQRTGAAIFAAGYPEQALILEPDLAELSFGAWQGRSHDDIQNELTLPAHPFWSIAGDERPPGGGESMADGIRRVGAVMERLARTYPDRDVIALTHGGVIRAAVAHALQVSADAALRLSVENLSLTRIDRLARGWLVDCVNELPGV